MGTRHLIAVVADGVHRIAQYGQWDGYPDGQGKDVLTFCRENLRVPQGRRRFRNQAVHMTRFVDSDELKKLWAGAGADPGSELVTMRVANEMKRQHLSLSRDCGSDVLDLVLNAKEPVLLTDSWEFAADSLFCEWAYVIDLDADGGKGALEVYAGFNKEPVPAGERFSTLEVEEPEHRRGKMDKYYPIRLAGRWSLEDLPSDDTFVAHFKDDDEDDEEEE